MRGRPTEIQVRGDAGGPGPCSLPPPLPRPRPPGRAGEGGATPPALPSPLRSLRPGRGVLVWGAGVREVAAQAAAWGVARGGRVVVLDGVQAFDPYQVVRQGALLGVGAAEVLRRVLVARAFTCHQLVRLAKERVPNVLGPGTLLVLLGPVSLFYDDQVPLPERRRLFRELLASLAAVKARAPLLLLQPPRPTGATHCHFGRELRELVDVVARYK